MNQFAHAFCNTKAFNQLVVHNGVFWTLIRAYNGLQRFHVRIKTLAIRMRYFLSFATLVIHLINVVPALFVPESELRIMRRCVQVIQ